MPTLDELIDLLPEVIAARAPDHRSHSETYRAIFDKQRNAQPIFLRNEDAVMDGTADDTDALNSALLKSKNGGGIPIVTGPGTIRITEAPTGLFNDLSIASGGGGLQTNGATKIVYDGPTITSLIKSENQTENVVNVLWDGIEVDGGGFVQRVIDLTGVSDSTLRNFTYYGGAGGTGGTSVGVLLDATGVSGSGKCYRNVLDNIKGAGLATDIRLRNGANANHILNGYSSGNGIGVEVLSSATRNTIEKRNFENNTSKCVYLDAPKTMLLFNGLESCPVGYHVTSNATDTILLPGTRTSGITTLRIDESPYGIRLLEISEGVYQFLVGGLTVLSTVLSGATNTDINVNVLAGDGDARIRFFLNTETTGDASLLGYKPDGSAQRQWELDAQTGNGYIRGTLEVDGDLNHDGSQWALCGGSLGPPPTITGSRGGNAALADLITKLALRGAVIDGTSA